MLSFLLMYFYISMLSGVCKSSCAPFVAFCICFIELALFYAAPETEVLNSFSMLLDFRGLFDCLGQY